MGNNEEMVRVTNPAAAWPVPGLKGKFDEAAKRNGNMLRIRRPRLSDFPSGDLLQTGVDYAAEGKSEVFIGGRGSELERYREEFLQATVEKEQREREHHQERMKRLQVQQAIDEQKRQMHAAAAIATHPAVMVSQARMTEEMRKMLDHMPISKLRRLEPAVNKAPTVVELQQQDAEQAAASLLNDMAFNRRWQLRKSSQGGYDVFVEGGGPFVHVSDRGMAQAIHAFFTGDLTLMLSEREQVNEKLPRVP